jgi:hypothetical protein
MIFRNLNDNAQGREGFVTFADKVSSPKIMICSYLYANEVDRVFS